MALIHMTHGLKAVAEAEDEDMKNEILSSSREFNRVRFSFFFVFRSATSRQLAPSCPPPVMPLWDDDDASVCFLSQAATYLQRSHALAPGRVRTVEIQSYVHEQRGEHALAMKSIKQVCSAPRNRMFVGDCECPLF